MIGWCMRLLVAGAIGAASLAAAGPAGAQRRPLPVEAFAQLPAIEGPELSPNGKAYAAKVAIDGRQYFAIVPLDGSKPRMLNAEEFDLNWWRWVNDEWLVLGVAQVQSYRGSDWYLTRAIGVPASGGEMVMLAARDAAQDADDVMWIATDGTPRVLMSYQTSTYVDEPGFWPRVDEIDVSTGKRRRVMDGRPGVLDWYADGQGTVRMGIGRSTDGRSVRILYRPDEDHGFRTIDKGKAGEGGLLVPSLFLPDHGKALVIEDDESGYSALYELDLATLERGRQLFATPGFDIGGLVPDATGKGYLGIHVNKDKPSVHWVDPAMRALQEAAAAQVQGAETRIVSVSRDKSAAIVFVGGADAPGAYFLYTPADKSMLLLAYNNKAIGLKRMHPVKTIRYKSRDGLEIAAVLTTPKGVLGKKLPLIVMPHGGPFARDIESWDWWAQFLADRGYAVVQPNYRGSSGYGTHFAQLGRGQWGLAMQDDLNDAVDALAERGLIDPERVCMVGASYGGYAAIRAAQRDGARYRCAVSYAGVSDLERMKSHNRHFLGWGARNDWLERQAPDLESVSPINFPEQISIPLLLVHGKKDRVVPIAQSQELAEEMEEAGREVTYVVQPEADHHFSREQDRLEFLKLLEAFLAEHNPA